MQEEVENRTVNLAITTTKLSWRVILAAAQKYLKHRANKKAIKVARAEKEANQKSTGKQTVEELIGQNQGVSSIDIAKTDLKGFENVARKYGVDYAIRQDISVNPPKYLVFFKARDADALTAAFNEFTAKALRKEERPSALKQLWKLKGLMSSLDSKQCVRDKQREVSR